MHACVQSISEHLTPTSICLTASLCLCLLLTGCSQIGHGSTNVRVGSSIFGARPPLAKAKPQETPAIAQAASDKSSDPVIAPTTDQAAVADASVSSAISKDSQSVADTEAEADAACKSSSS
jgi:hypothetical protein